MQGQAGKEAARHASQQSQQPWVLRQADWTGGTVFDILALDQHISENRKTNIRAIVQAVAPDDAATIEALAAACDATSCITIVTRNKDGSQKTPGACGAKLVFQMATITWTGPNVASIDPKERARKKFELTAVATVVGTKENTEVIKFTARKHWIPDARAWVNYTTHPRKQLGFWAASLPNRLGESLADGFRFVNTPVNNPTEATGLLRVKQGTISAWLQRSGKGGIHIDTFKGPNSTPAVVTWTKATVGENPEDFLKKMLDKDPELGLVLGPRDIGLRTEAKAGAPTARTWEVRGCPVDWTAETMKAVASTSAELKNVEVLRSLAQGHSRLGVANLLDEGGGRDRSGRRTAPLSGRHWHEPRSMGAGGGPTQETQERARGGRPTAHALQPPAAQTEAAAGAVRRRHLRSPRPEPRASTGTAQETRHRRRNAGHRRGHGPPGGRTCRTMQEVQGPDRGPDETSGTDLRHD